MKTFPRFLNLFVIACLLTGLAVSAQPASPVAALGAWQKVGDAGFSVGLAEFTSLTGTLSENFNVSPLDSNWVLLQNARLSSGWLQLTEASKDQAGNAVYNVPFSSSNYLDVEFDYAIHGGDGGDGLTFYLFDGSADPSPGSGGGNVGYIGIPNGYLGVGFTEYLSSNAVKLWGSGSGFNQLKAVTTVTTGERPGQHVRIVFKNNRIWVWLAGNLVIDNYNVAAAAGQAALPATLKFGFSGGTGYNTNIHEVDNLMVQVSDQFTRVKMNGATAGACGYTWANACDLQFALANASYGDELWVAAGTYLPTAGADRAATFQLKTGVAVYGGFAGMETARSQRQSSLYEATLLSGELGVAGISDNSYHVVKGATGATLDGFSITGGNADGASPNGTGGGMYNFNVSPTVTNVTFIGNSAFEDGGGMKNLNSSPTVTNVTFSGNSAFDGGGMSNIFHSNPTVTNVTFSGNSAFDDGGGMKNVNSNPTVTNVTFSGNSATYGGGMYSASNSNPTVTNVNFSGNSADRGGGMHNISGSNPTITHTTFSGNSATYGGGMHSASGSNPTITHTTFSSNSATYGGGMYSASGSNSTITHTTFSGNSATSGGGMYNLGSNPVITNVTFSGNSAHPYGGGIYNYFSSPTIIHTTFSGNSADKGGGMYNSGSIALIHNTILWGNTASTGTQIYHEFGSNPTITSSIVQGGYSGVSNLSTDPKLGTLGDYGGSTQTIPILFGSSAINKGDPAYCTAGKDQRGVSYVSVCDIGAYEYYYTAPAVTIEQAAGQPDPAAGLPVNFTVSFSEPIEPSTFTVEDITQDGSAAGVDWSILDAGDQKTFTLSATTSGLGTLIPSLAAGVVQDFALNGNTASTSIDNSVTLCASAITVTSNLDSGAGTLRQALVDLCAGGSITFNGDMTIPLASQLTISKDLTIDGETHNVTVSGENAVRVFYVSPGATTDLHNLTVANGGNLLWGNSGAGIYNRGTLHVTNGIFLGNISNSSGGGGGAIYNSYGTLTVTNSTFSGNLGGPRTNGGAIYNYYGTLTVTTSTFFGNRAAAGGGINNYYGTLTVANSTFSGNQAIGTLPGSGGGAMDLYGGSTTIVNSTIVGNTSVSPYAASSGLWLGRVGATLTLVNSLVANNNGSDNFLMTAGTFVSGGNNLSNNWDGLPTLATDLTGDPLPGPLGNYGGSTQTIPLLPGSPALDAGDAAICAGSLVDGLDQRGVMRPKGSQCDIGAVEMDPATFHTISGNVKESGVGVGGVTINYGFISTTTDSNGEYSFEVHDGWTGIVTPLLAGYVFAPVSQTYATPVTADFPSEDYIASNGVTISGQVSSGGVGVEGATITYGDGLSTITGSDGKYLFTVPIGWSGTVTPSKAGFTFLPSNRTYPSLAAHQADQDYAATLVEYTLTITSVHGAVTRNPDHATYHYGDLVELIPVPEAGWHFLEWSGSLTGSSTPGIILISGDASVTATFSNTYTLTYTPGEHGSLSGVSPQTVVQGADGSPVTAMPEAGYHFVDWSDGSTANPKTDTNVTADLSVTANFALNSYTVTFDTQGGPAVPSQNVDHGRLVTKPADLTRTGYTFGGWYDASNGGNLWDFASKAVTADQTLYARWNANSYIVSFNSQGGSTVPSQIVDYGNFATKPVDPILADYTFGGWYEASIAGNRWDFAGDPVTADQMLYAQWMLNSYTVTFDTQGGSTVTSQSVEHGGLVTEPTDPTRTGYTFDGWYNNALTWDFASDTITTDTTLTAHWMLNSYTVTFDSQGGSAVASQSVNYGGLVTKPADPTRTTYTFGGWYDASIGGSLWDFASDTISTNTTLYAQWTISSATFADVPITYWAWSYIERLYAAGITSGCATTPNLLYCPDSTVTRAQMAVFLLKSMHGKSYTPPLVGENTGFGDVATSHWAAAWIKQLAVEGITGGCGNSNYCPENPVTRAQMAVFLLKASKGSGYTPPAIGDGSGFLDVPNEHWAARWIKQLAADGITGGCGAGNYCPENPVTRAQMAVFLVRAFGLP